MVLGLIDFLLGGKKKTKVPRSGQVAAPLNSVGGSIGIGQQDNVNQMNSDNFNPSGSNNSDSSNANNELKFESSQSDSTNNETNKSQQFQSSASFQQTGNRKSISEVIHKIHDELKNTNEKINDIVSDIKKLESSVNNLGHRIDDIETSKKESDEKVNEIDRNMTKFLSLYELINNQYNPFVEQESSKPKEIVLENSGNNSNDSSLEDGSSKSIPSFDELKSSDSESNLNSSLNNNQKGNGSNLDNKQGDLDSTLLNLDTLDIEDAAADAVPLVNLKNNTNSLVTILSWLEYLIKREGVEKTRDSLRYYTDTLRWITPEVFFDLDKYLRGMKDKEDLTGNESLTVRDHIVSLYFISKLNEKVLDENLTKAVLQIIKG